MKSTVEKLSPTRVRINVEVPFTELQPDFERAYKQLAQQVRLPGFRPGRAPAKLLEARLGRGAVLQQVVNDVLPNRYSEAVTATDVRPLGEPEIEVTKIEDGDELVFTAEVDVRPDIDLPDLSTLTFTVDPIEVTDADVEAELDALRARFGTLKAVERAIQDGDFVTVDLVAAIDGEQIPEATAEGLTHEVGSGRLIEGLDDAVVGLAEGGSATFTTTLVAGAQAGEEAEVTVTVKAVKERELPVADDDFAQLASEFDTLEDLRANLTDQVRRVKRIHQAEKIRDTALESLLELVEVPLPDKIVKAQFDAAFHNAIHPYDHDEAKLDEMLEAQGSSRAAFEAETQEAAEKGVKTQLLMDAIADDLQIQVGQNDITERLVLMSRQYGIEPQQLLGLLQQNNQLPAVFADVRRGLTVAAVVEAATVVDTDGTVIDTAEFFGSPDAAGSDSGEAEEPKSKPAKKAAKKAAKAAEDAEGAEGAGDAEAAEASKAAKAAKKSPAKKAAANDAGAAKSGAKKAGAKKATETAETEDA